MSTTKFTSVAGIGHLAFRFVLIVGIANLFADMTYEGGRSITGPFLGSLGASATMVGFPVGFGELIGYALRSIYFVAGALLAAGFADFALIAFHFQKGGVVPQTMIPFCMLLPWQQER
jgi:hypothetical protein